MKSSTFGLIGLVVALVVSLGINGFLSSKNSNMNQELSSTQSQLQSVENERNELQKKVTEQESNIKSLEAQIKSGQKNEDLKEQQLQTVSQCVAGLGRAESLRNEGMREEALVAIGAIGEKCNESIKIMKAVLTKTDTTSNQTTDIQN